tara:strand:+ start:1875 stop:2978 length:1104 start_codon:yes stop_codon:yes gene_type:complete
MDKHYSTAVTTTGRFWASAALTLTIALCLTGLFFTVMMPFLGAIVWAAILADALHPIHSRLTILFKGRDGLSALLTCLGMLLLIIMPAIYLAMLLGQELVRGISIFQEALRTGSFPLLDWLNQQPLAREFVSRVEEYFQQKGKDIRTVVLDNVTQVGGTAAAIVSAAVGNIVMGTLSLAITVVTVFFFLRDGKELVDWLCEVLPFPRERQRLLLGRMHIVVRATVYGVGLVALTEGLLGGLAFWVLGLPTPVLWGTVITIMAFLPVLGASVVWAPAAIMLAMQGAYLKAILLTVWGIVVIGFLVDYVLRTFLIGHGTQLHVLLVFFSVLGGIAAFGLVGIVAGPLIMATSLALIESSKLKPSAPSPT